MSNIDYRGIYAPVLTPFTDTLKIDYDDLNKMVDFTIAGGNHGIVTTANAAEFYTMTDEEHHDVIKAIVDRVDGRIPVMAGIAGWSTEHSIYHAQFCESVGCVALMATPPVIKPIEWDDIRRFYERLDHAVNIPICIQNAPPMGAAMTPEQMLQLARENEKVLYVKEETPFEMNYVSALADAGKTLPKQVFGGVMCGNSGLTIIDNYLRGACGCMPANHLSDIFVTIWELMEQGRMNEAIEIYEAICPLLIYEGMYWRPNFSYILYRRGVFKTVASRARAIPYTRAHYEEVDRLLKLAEPYYRVEANQY